MLQIPRRVRKEHQSDGGIALDALQILSEIIKMMQASCSIGCEHGRSPALPSILAGEDPGQVPVRIKW